MVVIVPLSLGWLEWNVFLEGVLSGSVGISGNVGGGVGLSQLWGSCCRRVILMGRSDGDDC